MCWIFSSSTTGFSGVHFPQPIWLTPSDVRMHVIIQVHAEPSARGCVIEIWIESFHSGPRAESLAWTSKISENRGARTSLIWAGENETLKNSGVVY